MECLKEKTAFHPKLAQFYTCGGENKCLWIWMLSSWSDSIIWNKEWGFWSISD
jgi:hypothetical protein